MTVGDRPTRSWSCGLGGRSGLVAGFLGDTRAGAVGISSVLIALMCFTGTAFVSDHVVLLHHRNVLQAAVASASIAATQHLAKLDTGLTDGELAGALEPLARRYVLANLPEGTRESARDSLEVALTPDREAGVVGVEVSADLGGAIVGRGNYRHGSVSRTEYSSQYTGYGRAGSGSIEEGYRVGTRLTGLSNDRQDRDILNTILLEACELAKGDGVTAFTVSAVPNGHPKEQELRDRLVACATSEEHAFVENSDPELMKTAFQEIGRMVQGIRRTRTVISGLQ